LRKLENLLAGSATDERLAERLRAKPHALHHLVERGWVEGVPPLGSNPHGNRGLRRPPGRQGGYLPSPTGIKEYL